MARQPLARALLDALKDYGAGEIFCIPEGFALPFFREIEAAGTLPLYTRYNDLDDWRFAEMAPLLGGVGRRVWTRAEFAEALREAHDDGVNWRLIEIMPPRDRYSPTLDRFVGAVKRRSVMGE
jgi:TPP-dependent 2-oxoacid decarboxylase